MAALFEPFVGLAVGAAGGAFAMLMAWIFGRSTGRRDAEQKQAADAAQAEREAHERINNAPTGGGLSDDERREWLRDIAATWAKHNGPPKT